MSSGRPHLPTGMREMKNWWSSGLSISGAFISVLKGPGLIVFTVMPSPASSRDRARVRPNRADLVAEYAVRPGSEIQPIIDDMLRTRP